jgi:Alpha-2-macroglobulin bait region domain
MFFFSNRPTIFSPVKLRATIGTRIDSIYVHVSSKGILLHSKKVKFPECTSNGLFSVDFEINPTSHYMPEAHVVAYYFNDSYIEVANTTVLLIDKLPNFVKFSLDKEVVEPGENIGLTVESYLGSTVSLSAVDQRYTEQI